jgi:hypothetical protein
MGFDRASYTSIALSATSIELGLHPESKEFSDAPDGLQDRASNRPIRASRSLVPWVLTL